MDVGAKSEAFLAKDLAEKQHAVDEKIRAFVTSISSNGIHLSQKTQESLQQKLIQAKEEQRVTAGPHAPANALRLRHQHPA